MNNPNPQSDKQDVTPSGPSQMPDGASSVNPASAAESQVKPKTAGTPADAPVETTCPQPQQAAKVSDNTSSPFVERKLTRAQRERTKKWSNDNRRTFRSDAEVDAAVGAECDATGCTETDAIKRLLLRGAGKERVVLLTAAAPEHLAKVILASNELARSVRSVRSRINASTDDTGDAELNALLKKWRQTSQELPPKLAAVTAEIQVVVRTITRLTPENVRRISGLQKTFQTEIDKLRKDAVAAETDETKQILEGKVKRRGALIEVLTALGIFQPTPPCPPPK